MDNIYDIKKNNLMDEYNNVCNKLSEVDSELNELEKEKIIIKYNNDLKVKKYLNSRKNEIYERIKINEFETCRHVFVNGICIKCGLNIKMYELEYINYDNLNINSKIIFNYLLTKKIDAFTDYISIDMDVPRDLVKKTYDKINTLYPDKSEDEKIYYLKCALHNMHVKDFSEKRINSRVRRLKLDYSFTQYGWDYDV